MKKRLWILMGIVFLGILLRTINPNWDQNNHLHPDERFLTMVGNAMEIPISISEYFNQNQSLLNPRNIGHDFYVYGTFPVTLNKFIAVAINNDNYQRFVLQGRVFSAVLDSIMILLVYFFAVLLEKKRQIPKFSSLWAAFFYATSVLMIQLSHFFTVDIFAHFFLFSSTFVALLYGIKKQINPFWYLVGSGTLFGLALASKINVILMLPIPLFFFFKKLFSDQKITKITSYIFFCIVFAFTAYFSLRISDPYLFEKPSILDPRISAQYTEDLKLLKSWSNPDVWFPPALQWIQTQPLTFASKNIFFFGFGISGSLFFLLGSYHVLQKSIKKPQLKTLKKNLLILFPLFWVLLFFLYQSTQFVKSLRYFLYLYPYFALYAGIGAAYGIDIILKKNSGVKKCKNHLRRILPILIALATIIWPLMFISIYLRPHSRVTASQWIYANLPNNSVIANELWDDPLPLGITTPYPKNFSIEMLGVFDPDTPEKHQLISQQLGESDYYVLSSNRAWGSIMQNPDRYPYTSDRYRKLLSDQDEEFKLVAEFTSYPSLEYLGIPFTLRDDWAEEAFTVYDHPQVLIFQKRVVE